MDRKQKNLIVGGAVVLTAVAGAAFLYSRGKEIKKPVVQSKAVTRELAVRILKEIQREMFTVLTNVAMLANQIKEHSRGRAGPQEIKDFLLNHNPQTKDQIKNIAETICDKYGLEEKDLRHACEITYQDDTEIRTMLNDAKAVFDKAFQGTPPDFRTEIPAFLTPELTLTLMQKIMKESLFKIQDFLNDLKNKGVSISYNNPQVLMGLQDLKVEDIRKNILVAEGLDKFQDPPLKIFQYAIQKYSTDDIEQFNQKFMKLEMQNQRATDALMKGATDAPIMIEAIGAHLLKDSQDVTSSHLRNIRAHAANAQKVSALKKAEEEANYQEESEKVDEKIKNLQSEVSFQLKSALEDGEFPKELVESALNTLFNVFDNVNKSAVKSDDVKDNLVKGAVAPESEEKKEEHIVSHTEDKKVTVINDTEADENATVTETETKDVKEVVDAEGVIHPATVTEQTVVLETDGQIRELRIQETIIDKTTVVDHSSEATEVPQSTETHSEAHVENTHENRNE